MYLKTTIFRIMRGVRAATAEMKNIAVSNGNINFICILMFLITFVVLLITEVSLSTYYKNHNLQLQNDVALENDNYIDYIDKNQNVSIPKDAVWQNVAGSKYKYFVYSAFLDKRSKKQWLVRIIAATRTKFPDKSLCIMHFANSDEKVPAKVKPISENWGLPYSASFVTCNLKNFSHIPYAVSISVYSKMHSSYIIASNNMIVLNRNVSDQTLDKNKDKISVCVKPIHYSYDKTVQLIEFIELNRLLGITHFSFYLESSSTSTKCVLDHYIREGIASVHSWKLNIKSKVEIRTEGMFAAMNDCLYRNMYNYPYIAFIDLDEFIVPRFNSTLIDLIKWLGIRYNTKTISSYSFQNAFFYMQWADDDDIKYANDIEKNLLSIRKTRRKTKLNAHKQRSKYIAKAKNVVEVGNHFVWQFFPNQNTLNVPSEIAILHHYRVCEFGGDDCVHLPSTVDRTLYKYRKMLTCKVAQKWLPMTNRCNLPELNFDYYSNCN